MTLVSSHPWTIAISAVAFVMASYLISRRNKNKRNFPPGPKGVPLYGNLLDIKRSDVNGPGILDKWAAEFGDIYSLRLGSYDTVVLNSPDVLREAFLKNGEVTSGRPLNVFFFRLLMGPKGILNNEGPGWKNTRRTALHSLRDFGMGKKSMEERIQEEARALVGAIDLRDEQPFHPRELLHNAFSNVICAIIFGERYEYGDEEFRMVAESLNSLFAGGGLKNPEMFIPILTPLVPILNLDLLRASRNLLALRKYVKQKVDQHRKTFDANDIKSFIDIYIRATQTGELNDNGQEDLLVSILDLFLAGTETSTTSLLWALLYLVHYPEVQAKCQRSIGEIIGQVRPPLNSDRHALPYIEATIYEVQRIGTISSYGVIHRASKDVELSGYTIPEDTLIISNLHRLHMDPDYWGDPEVFRPDRWLGEDGKLIKHDHFMPFSTGPRECMGKSLALQEMFIVLVSLLQKFTFTATDPGNLPKLGGAMGATYAPHAYQIIARRN